MRPLAVAMCDLDAVFLSGAIPIAEPFPLGHECVAEVIEVGDAVRGVAPGDIVVVPFQISCGECAACALGHTGSCRSVPRGSAYGMQPLGGAWGGALADVLRVPFADAMLVALPDGLDPVALASVADNVPDGYRAVAGPLAQAPGADVLVVGGWARSVGLYAAACALALGAGRVVYADTDAGRLERAAALGAEPVAVPAGEEGHRRGRTSSGASRSRSMPRATTPACTPRCARPPRTASAPASRSTSSRRRRCRCWRCTPAAARCTPAAATRGR